MISVTNRELVQISDWLNANKLSLNIKKTSYAIFTFRQKKYEQTIPVMVNDIPLNQVKNTKFLGVIIDENLSWKAHIDMLCEKISKTVGIIPGGGALMYNGRRVCAAYKTPFFTPARGSKDTRFQ